MPQGLVCSIRENVKCYYNAVIQIGGIDLITSTLWAKIPLEEAYQTERGVSDFHRILYNGETLTFDNFNHEHNRCFQFIQKAVADKQLQSGHSTVDDAVGSVFSILTPEAGGQDNNQPTIKRRKKKKRMYGRQM